MQRLALFDLDRTLIDLDAAFLLWVEEFAQEHNLGHRAVRWLVALDRNGFRRRELFFAKVREQFKLSTPTAVRLAMPPRSIQAYADWPLVLR